MAAWQHGSGPTSSAKPLRSEPGPLGSSRQGRARRLVKRCRASTPSTMRAESCCATLRQNRVLIGFTNDMGPAPSYDRTAVEGLLSKVAPPVEQL